MKLLNTNISKAEPSNMQMQKSARLLIKEGALASVIFSLATGNFLAGYLAFLGADTAFCALIAALPQLGCVMQLISPFLFERLRYRKNVIILCCFLFRASLPLAGLAPLLFSEKDSRLSFVFAIYLFAFFAAGFVTPGLTSWVMEIAPKEKRGAYFARKDITASIFNAIISLVLSSVLDKFISKGNAYSGFMIVFAISFLIALLDASIMSRFHERAAPFSSRLAPAALLSPLKDKSFRPFIAFMILFSFAQGLCVPFLPAHMVTSLQLSHTFIAGMGIASSFAAMLGISIFGRMADKKSWQRVMLLTAFALSCIYILWGFVSIKTAFFAAPLLQCATGACNGAFNTASMNLQYLKSPAQNKTVYLGVTAALFNMASYSAALLAALFVSKAALLFNINSVSLLLTFSGAVLFCITAIYGKKAIVN